MITATKNSQNTYSFDQDLNPARRSVNRYTTVLGVY